MEDQKNQTKNSTSAVDTTPKVTGIGGIFFFSDNPPETKEWYAKIWGLKSMNGAQRVLKPETLTGLMR